MTHSSHSITSLISFAEGAPGKIVVVMADSPPYFAGIRQPPQGTLLEFILSTIGNHGSYQSVVICSGRGKHLSPQTKEPKVTKVSKDVRLGVLPCSWFYRGADRFTSSTAQQNLNRWENVHSASLRERGKTIISERREGSWESGLDWLFDQLQGRLDVMQKSIKSHRELLLVDVNLFQPNPRQLHEKLHALRLNSQPLHEREDFNETIIANREQRFLEIASAIQSSRIDLVLFSNSSSAYYFFQNGELIRWQAQVYKEASDGRSGEAEANGSDVRAGKESIDPFVNSFPRLSISGELKRVIVHSFEDDLAVPALYKAKLIQLSDTQSGYSVARTVIPIAPKTAIDELNALIGLDNVKDQVRNWINYAEVEAVKARNGSKTQPLNLNLFMYGPPGIGKTAVARILGRIIGERGFLTGTKFKEVGAKDLLGKYVGESRQKTQEVCESSVGGVLFIDEAYDLMPREGNSFGDECITTLLKWLNERPTEIAFIFAGYKDKMEALIKANDGFQRRIRTKFDFLPYSTPELLSIAKYMVNNRGEVLLADCDSTILECVEQIRANRERKGQVFGNAGEIEQLISNASIARAKRIVGTDLVETEGTMFRGVDFENALLLDT